MCGTVDGALLIIRSANGNGLRVVLETLLKTIKEDESHLLLRTCDQIVDMIVALIYYRNHLPLNQEAKGCGRSARGHEIMLSIHHRRLQIGSLHFFSCIVSNFT